MNIPTHKLFGKGTWGDWKGKEDQKGRKGETGIDIQKSLSQMPDNSELTKS